MSRMGWRTLGILLLAAGVVAVGLAAVHRHTVLPLKAQGVTYGPDGGLVNIPVDAEVAYVPGTSVLSSAADGSAQLIDADRAWLAAGSVPGRDTPYGDMVERALLDLRALNLDGGAAIAGNRPSWRYVWPRDAAFAVAAFSVTGHHDDAERILRFLWSVAPDDGVWHARYLADGSGRAPDGREPQLDGSGWVPWALWTWVTTHPDREFAATVAQDIGMIAIRSADALVAALGDDGLPRPSSDYWERPADQPTLGTVGPASFGLRATLALAPTLGVDPARWRDASHDLDAAIKNEFASHGYPRTVPDGGADAAIGFFAPPFAAADEQVRDAVLAAQDVLAVPNGGLGPGEAWGWQSDEAWTPATGFVALAFAGLGEVDAAESLLGWMDAHRTSVGALPEKVDAVGEPATVAPLSIAASLVILTVVQLEDGLPVVPAS